MSALMSTPTDLRTAGAAHRSRRHGCGSRSRADRPPTVSPAAGLAFNEAHDRIPPGWLVKLPNPNWAIIGLVHTSAGGMPGRTYASPELPHQTEEVVGQVVRSACATGTDVSGRYSPGRRSPFGCQR
jgi:hypothetical protein